MTRLRRQAAWTVFIAFGLFHLGYHAGKAAVARLLDHAPDRWKGQP